MKKPDMADEPDSIDFGAVPQVFDVDGKKTGKSYYWGKDGRTGLDEYKLKSWKICTDAEVIARYAKGDAGAAKVIQGEQNERYVLLERDTKISEAEREFLRKKGIDRIKAAHKSPPGHPSAKITYGKEVIMNLK